ncbi:TIGR04086 family membrane protein [Oscillospiraceae bacterium PP1C4]
MKQPDVNSIKRFIRPITFGVVFGTAACFILLILMSIVMGLQDIPQSIVALTSTLIFIVGGFVAGYVCAMLSHERGMMLGFCCGTCLFCMLSLASLALDGSGFGMLALTKLVAVLISAALGGIIGVNKKKKLKFM